MSPQTYTIAIVYSLLLIISTGTAWKQQGFSLNLAWSFLLSLGLIALVSYDTLCLTQGNCGVWSWIRTVIYILIPVILIIMWTITLFQKDESSQNNPAVSVTVPTTPTVYVSAERL